MTAEQIAVKLGCTVDCYQVKWESGVYYNKFRKRSNPHLCMWIGWDSDARKFLVQEEYHIDPETAESSTVNKYPPGA